MVSSLLLKFAGGVGTGIFFARNGGLAQAASPSPSPPSAEAPSQPSSAADTPATSSSVLPPITGLVTDEDSLGALAWTKTWGIGWIEDWDHASQRGIAGHASSNFKRQILLIRHGQYENEQSNDDTVRHLTDLGRKQATATGAFLRSALPNSPLFAAERPQFMFVSDMLRAQQTAELIREALGISGLQLTTDKLLRERFPCDPSPPFKKKKAKLDSMVEAEKAYMKYFHRPARNADTVEVIVGHGNMIRYFLCRALQLPPEAWLRFSLPHCSITSVTIRGNGHVSVNQVGSAGHLEPTLQSVHNLP